MPGTKTPLKLKKALLKSSLTSGQSTAAAAAAFSSPSSQDDLTIAGPPLRLVQVVCAFLSLLSLAVCVASIPLTLALYDRLCSNLNDPCLPQLTHADLDALQAIGLSQQGYINVLVGDLILQYALALAFAGLLIWRKPDHIFSLLWATSNLMMASFPFTAPLANMGPVEWRGPALLFYSLGFWLIFLCIYLFPNMRFTPAWSWTILAFYVLVHLSYNIFTKDGYAGGPGGTLITQLAFVILLAGGLGSQVYRYLRVSNQLQRQQTKWALYGLSLLFITGSFFGLLPTLFPTLGQPGSLYILFSFPILSLTPYFLLAGIAFGILRYRLWDIDLIINRTLIYFLLTTGVVVFYALIVEGLGRALSSPNNPLLSLAATALIAILFQPAKERLQRAVNRLLYGQRHDPYRVLASLGQRLNGTLTPDQSLPTIVETVATSLKLPYSAISLLQPPDLNEPTGPEFKVVAEYGLHTGSSLTTLPLVYQSETIGQLLLAPRAAGENFSSTDLRLLNDLAGQAGAAVQAVRLTADLQRSRERVITVSEEERRRLRRDLHDGIGPTMASLIQRLAITGTMIESDPRGAVQKIVEIKDQAKATLAEIRRIVYALRPPALDEYGLVSAIREHAAGLYPLQVQVEVPNELPPLSAASEVAAYRIILEALTNVERHARAEHCLVRLSTSNRPNLLVLEIWDDGAGLPSDYRAGVGLTSMRERASELGGEYRIEARPDGSSGTRVRVALPRPDQALT